MTTLGSGTGINRGLFSRREYKQKRMAFERGEIESMVELKSVDEAVRQAGL